MKIRLTKEFNFEMSHALHKYDGLCKNIHGHSYKLFVCLRGEPIQDKNSSKNGMVIDFGDLKEIIFQEIIEPFDHALVLNSQSTLLDKISSKDTKIIITPYQPTCENFLLDFVERIRPRLDKNIELVSIKLHETSTSYAEWYLEDNK